MIQAEYDSLALTLQSLNIDNWEWQIDQIENLIFEGWGERVLARDLHDARLDETLESYCHKNDLLHEDHIEGNFHALSLVNRVKTPAEKLSCIHQFCKDLLIDNDSEKDSPKVHSADVLLPRMIDAVLDARVPLLISNISYIRRFRCTHHITGDQAYSLTTLMASIQAIFDERHKSILPPITVFPENIRNVEGLANEELSSTLPGVRWLSALKETTTNAVMASSRQLLSLITIHRSNESIQSDHKKSALANPVYFDVDVLQDKVLSTNSRNELNNEEQDAMYEDYKRLVSLFKYHK